DRGHSDLQTHRDQAQGERIMTGAQLGQVILALIAVAALVAIVAWLLNWLYLRSSKERAFVRTGFGGQKVVLNGGALVLPIIHEVIPVNTNTLRLDEKRGDYVKRVRAVVSADLLQNGLELETVSLTQLDQTAMEFFNPSNAFDAEGLTRLTETIETRKKQRNDIEQDTMIQIRNKNLD